MASLAPAIVLPPGNEGPHLERFSAHEDRSPAPEVAPVQVAPAVIVMAPASVHPPVHGRSALRGRQEQATTPSTASSPAATGMAA